MLNFAGWEINPEHCPCRPLRTERDQSTRPAPRSPKHKLRDILEPAHGELSRTARGPLNYQTCNAQEVPQPLSRRERSKIVQRCLGKPGPTHKARASLSRQLDMLEKEYNMLTINAKEIRRAKKETTDVREWQRLETDAQEMEELAYKHLQGLRGLKGQLS